MYTLIILLLLCIIEFGLVYWKYSEIKEYIEISQDVAAITGLDKTKRYSDFVRTVGQLLSFGSYVFWIVIPIAFIINLIIASILGAILSFIF